MTGANTPPSAADIGKLLARVEKLERAFQPGGIDTLGGLIDVDADYPADLDALTFDATLGKWVNKPPAAGPSTYPVGPLDDGTATYEITAASLVQKMSTVVNGTGQNAYFAVGANTTVQQASMHADDNAGNAAQIDVIVAAGTPFIALTAGTSVLLHVKAGNPNGSLSANKGDVCFDTSTPQIWVNTTGGTVWVNP